MAEGSPVQGRGVTTRGLADLGDDKEGEVHAVHEQVRDGAAHIGLRALHVLVHQDLLQAGGDNIAYQQAIVPPHGLNALQDR